MTGILAAGQPIVNHLAILVDSGSLPAGGGLRSAQEEKSAMLTQAGIAHGWK